jgi:hypothetical protein
VKVRVLPLEPATTVVGETFVVPEPLAAYTLATGEIARAVKVPVDKESSDQSEVLKVSLPVAVGTSAPGPSGWR